MVFAVYGICTVRGLYVHTAQGGTISCTVKTMRQLCCTDRPYKATARLASAPEYSTLAVQRQVVYARHCSYSSIA